MRESKRLEEERERILVEIEAPPQNDGMPHGKGNVSDPTGNAAVKSAPIAKMIARKLDKPIAIRLRMAESLAPFPPSDRHLICLRHADGLSWPRVGADIWGQERFYRQGW